MKRKAKTLKLNRETLRVLETSMLQVVGAAETQSCSYTCDTCVSWCHVCYTKERSCDCF